MTTAAQRLPEVTPNNAFERTVKQRGPRLAVAQRWGLNSVVSGDQSAAYNNLSVEHQEPTWAQLRNSNSLRQAKRAPFETHRIFAVLGAL
jgi:hypothetical protein